MFYLKQQKNLNPLLSALRDWSCVLNKSGQQRMMKYRFLSFLLQMENFIFGFKMSFCYINTSLDVTVDRCYRGYLYFVVKFQMWQHNSRLKLPAVLFVLFNQLFYQLQTHSSANVTYCFEIIFDILTHFACFVFELSIFTKKLTQQTTSWLSGAVDCGEVALV